ncbi:PREDICTED: E3 ubiquitin-protein ligase UBR3 isoform X2 [Nicrophorus vespilloides]|uniref:E3 ubiquitin-protein ligase n=1 Tax=Nicrophorus vespilloides TaxID=110193 RepID=A0ABM1NFH1_NICVS|nr:PREDICTED: E3 ubiquitin-protein ligase UBR3 isoform X2 [Nicrophorus vespilloides]
MASKDDFEVRVLISKGKRAAAAYVHADCANNAAPRHLNEVLDNLLNPSKAIDEWEAIDWCKWLIAGGRTPDEFASTVRTFDNATTCGLVWTPNFVAYRCRTCGISPCMSLCTECFKKGNHQRHDFNMFLSQAGGACDCGDTSVMKETGFCDRHGPNKSVNTGKAPSDLMCVAQAMMPRIIMRLVLHLRENSVYGNPDAYKWAINDADAFITMLLDFNNMGGLMRRVMTSALTNPQMYRVLNEQPDPLPETDYAQFLANSKKIYQEALKGLPNPVPLDEYKDCPSLQENLVHKTFLEELVFWTVKFEFPQKVVCLLLNMLPDADYKEALTRAFVLHYSRISMMLERSADPDTLSNRVVHVSVQLFSNEGLALRMTEQLNLLHVMVVSLKYMMSKILIQNTLHDPDKNFHYVVDCGRPVMKEHCYWPLVSDLNNVLSHRPVALRFMSDDSLLEMWFTFLSMFQGMNVNQRELNQHVEFEPTTYYAAFSAELEASAYPMWALVSHLVDASTSSLTRRVLTSCLAALQEWLDAINYTNPVVSDSFQVSFHLPLHRYLAVFLCQAVAKQSISLNEVLPSPETLHLLMMHPLRVQVAFYEILNGLWVRNGLQIKGQAMTYIQSNFCNSMVDADLYLLQICSTRIPAENFLNIVIEKFHVKEWMSVAPYQAPQNSYLEGEHDTPMLESFLTFLTTLVSVRTNLGLLETDVNRLEMITLLCMGDKTHSQLMELMPERCGTSQSRDFEALLAEVADYRAPALEATGNMQQGMYVPKSQIWKQEYDPIHVLLRAVHRRDFQTSMDRYTDDARHGFKLKTTVSSLWPPFREPSKCGVAYEDPRMILRSRVFHTVALIVLYKAMQNHVSEHVLALIVFLLEQAIQINESEAKNEASSMCTSGSQPHRPLNDMDLTNWFATDSLSENLRTVIGRVILTPEPEVSPITYSSDSSDLEWENSESDILMLEDGTWNNPGPSTQPSNIMMLVPTVPRNLPMTTMAPMRAIQPAETTPTVANVVAVVPPPMATSTTEGGENSYAVALSSNVSVMSSSTNSSSSSSHPALPAPPPPPLQHRAILEATNNEILAGMTAIAGQLSASSSLAVRPSTSSSLVPTRRKGRGSPYYCRRQGSVEGGGSTSNNPPSVKINESVVSLLLKLHSQLAGVPDSYNVDEAADRRNPVAFGDGTFYVARLLDRIAGMDQQCKDSIQETKNRLWPKQEEGEEEQIQRENKEREERRRRAKERQRQLMQEFANKQKQFMESAMETETENKMDWSPTSAETSEPMNQEYDCVICNQSSPSTEERPMGLVVLVQATSVMGHRRRAPHPERSTLPTCEEEKESLKTDDTLLSDFDRRCEELNRYFDPESWLLSINIGWEGGVHVQTCGHHLHLHCLKSYLYSLRSQQRQQSLAPDKGEYLCPLCRQLANSVLPLSPQLGECSQMVRSRPSSMADVLNELGDFLRENEQTPSTSNLSEAMGKAMEDMTSSTQLKAMFKPQTDKPSHQSLFLFVTSIARTNLEVELVQRGGSLVTLTAEPPNPLLPKRDCIVPLLHVLAVHARVLALWPASMTFQQLCRVSMVNALAPIEKEVPLLIRDPIALLLHFVLLLPLHLDQTYFTTVVKMVYNLVYYQVVSQISCGLTGAERAKACEGASVGHIDSFAAALALINQSLGESELYMEDDGAGCSSTQVNVVALEQQVQKLCLPFLRIASLLRHHIYNQPLPDIRAPQSEFVRLVYYLELVTEGMDWGCFNSAVALNWPLDTDAHVHRSTPSTWCLQLASYAQRYHIAAKSFLVDQHITWQPPRLLELPREYEKIFTYYHERPCSQCHSVPQETSICLLCGTIVCLKQNCCKQQNVCEAVAHSLECGAGTGVFLVVTSTYIIVIRGRRACLWGSLYLDDFEEEDRDLKRGKPLYLSKDRYQLLEQQWLAHRFDHTKKTWVWHRDAL